MSAEAHQPTEEVAETPPKKQRGMGMFAAIKAAGFVAVIVIVEVVAASMLAPSAEDTEKLAQQFVAASEGHAAVHEEEGHNGHGEGGHDVREVELGTYNITRFNPATSTTLAIDFELFGVVLATEATDFEHHFEKSQARIREQVTMSLHSATSADLTDAGLGLIKRRILEKTNHALGQPLIKEVVFSKFNFVER